MPNPLITAQTAQPEHLEMYPLWIESSDTFTTQVPHDRITPNVTQ
jgi:hypothetical protein